MTDLAQLLREVIEVGISYAPGWAQLPSDVAAGSPRQYHGRAREIADEVIAALTVLQAANKQLALRVNSRRTGECPFDNPRYRLGLDVPCPVCGDLGHITDEPSKCVDP